MSVQFHFAARSDVGLVRKNNQDSGYAGPHLLVLADGMGGPAGGDIASSVALAHLVPLDEDTVPADELLPLLRGALQDAHNELIERSQVDQQLRGLGTTCIALLRSGNKMAMVHIGDSRAYLLRDGVLTQITTDHSFVQYLVDTGQITAQEAETHPKRNAILRVLGDTQGAVAADESVRQAVEGDRWLLCSDGLSGVVSAETIQEVLAAIKDPGECIEELIQLALLAGAPDNVTCVLADIVSSAAAAPTTPQIVGAAAIDRAAPTRGGKGAAGRAAALRPEVTTDVTDADDDAPRRRGKRWFLGMFLVVLVAVIAVGGWFGWQWTQTQYFVLASDEGVVVYQGIPQTIGPWDLAKPIEVTDLRLTDLPIVDQQRLKDPVTRSSLEGINQYLSELRTRGVKAQQESHKPTVQKPSTSPSAGTPSPQSGG